MLLGDNRVTSVAWASSGEFIASGLLLAGTGHESCDQCGWRCLAGFGRESSDQDSELLL